MPPHCDNLASATDISFQEQRAEAGLRAWLNEPPQLEAFARLHHLLSRRFGCGVLSGPAHCGKTLILQAFWTQAARTDCRPVLLNGSGLDADSLLWELAAVCGLGLAPNESPRIVRLSVSDYFTGLLESGRQLVLLLDHADAMATDALHAFTRLLRPAESCGRLTVIWSARTPLAAGVREILLPLTELRIDVSPLSESATEAFVLQASGQPAGTFEPQAVAAIRQHSAGRLRRVDHLCRLAMLAAQADDRPVVTRELIDAAALELA